MTKSEKTLSERSLWTRYFILVVAISFTAYISFHGLNSGTTVYLSFVGGTASFAGILAAIYSVAAGVARMATGPLIDTKGRVVVISFGAVVFVAGSLVLGFIQNNAVFIIARILQGIGFGSITTAAATVVADVVPSSRLGEGLGYYGLGNALAASIGPAFALFLVSTDPPENLFYGLSVMAIIVFALSLFCHYEKHVDKLPLTSPYRVEKKHPESEQTERQAKVPGKRLSFWEPHALCGAVPVLFISSANAFSVFFVGLYGTSIGLGNAGLYFTFSAISMVLVRLKAKAYMDKVLPIKTLTVAVGAGVLGLLLLLIAPQNHIFFYLAGLMYGFSIGISIPLNQSVAIKNTPSERWGSGNALFFLACDIGVTFTSILWGYINDHFGFSFAIIGAATCLLLGYVSAWIVYPKSAKRKEATEQKAVN